MLELIGISVGGLVILTLILGGWWNADKIISKDFGKALGAKIKATSTQSDFNALSDDVRTFLSAHLGTDLPIRRFLWSVLLSSLLGLVTCVMAYLSLNVGFGQQVLWDWTAFVSAARGFIGYGVVAVVICTYLSFFLQGSLLPRLGRTSLGGLVLFAVFDLAFRLFVFTVVTAVVFVAFATWRGSFNGDVSLALGAVWPTISAGIRLENLSAAYIYAATFSSFPLFLLIGVRSLQRSARLRELWVWSAAYLPMADKPMRFAALCMGISLAILILATALLGNAVTYYTS